MVPRLAQHFGVKSDKIVILRRELCSLCTLKNPLEASVAMRSYDLGISFRDDIDYIVTFESKISNAVVQGYAW